MSEILKTYLDSENGKIQLAFEHDGDSCVGVYVKDEHIGSIDWNELRKDFLRMVEIWGFHDDTK